MTPPSPKLLLMRLTLFVSICMAGLLIYFVNYPILAGSYYHYWGLNYYLNGLLNQSYQSWQKALGVPSPYLDDSRVDFATMLQQSFQSGLSFEPIEPIHQEGIRAMKEAIARHRLNYFYYNFLAEYYNVFHQYGQGYLDEADKLSIHAWSLSPNRQQILYIMAKTALLRNDTRKGLQLFQQAVDLNPSAGDPHFYLGLLLWERGDRKQGLTELTLAWTLNRHPRTLQEAILVGNIVGDAGDYDWAIEIYQIALADMRLRQQPDFSQKSPDLKLKIAVAYYLKGDREKARGAFLALSKEVNLAGAAVYKEIRPMLDDLGLRP